ncbi:MAG: glutamate mutase L [Anaerolineales bacterium]|nr:glutamate mutase L [Chloroflexota bacterium]MBL6979714.1 glutamate mutase L [Anaerolineales bacterium]
MTSSVVSADSILAIDVGTINTRASLFDVVGSRYRFVASGTAPTTIAPPFSDVREGISRAINLLQETTGRLLIGSDGNILIPSHPDGTGIDAVTATLSAGPEIKVVAVGLLEDVSMESARNLAITTYAKVSETISLNDRRKQDERIDAILRARPDLVIVAGGIDGGATRSVNQLLEAVGLACFLLPRDQRPQVLFAGNNNIHEEIKETIAPLTDLHLAPNIRPGIHSEQLAPAQISMSKIFKNVRAQQIFGVSDLDQWANGRLLPTSTAFGRVVRFLSHIYDPNKGVLGVDIGASATTIAAALKGKLGIRVFPQLGLGSNLENLSHYISTDHITFWLSEEIPKSSVRDYLFNKAAHPASIPATVEEMAIEQALGRQMMRSAVSQMIPSLPFTLSGPEGDLLPWVEPILASGSILSNAPTPGQSMLMILDGLQPTGITTIVLDKNKLLASLGAAAEINPLMAVQVLESHAFQNLGTIIAPVGSARKGTPVLRIRTTLEDTSESQLEVKFGSIEVIPLPTGQSAQIQLRPLHRFDVGMGGPGKGGRVRVVGGSLGIVIDARGRPLQLPSDHDLRREQLKRWLWTLGN